MATNDSRTTPVWAILVIFLRLGLTSFGGPIAHLGYFHEEFVRRRQWLEESAYADLVALCQFLPGPASSQVGMAVGLMRGGYAGALAAWLGFTAPSAVFMILFALGVATIRWPLLPEAMHGLRIAAVAVVAQAIWGMAQRLCPDRTRVAIMAFAAAALLLLPGVATQIAILLAAALLGTALFARPEQESSGVEFSGGQGKRGGIACLAHFLLLFAAFPLLAGWRDNRALAALDAFYRAGSLVFGGGNVILPLLQSEVVETGWLTNDVFLAGYGAAQAVPGPLLSFSAFLGASMDGFPGRPLGGILCLLAMFLPSFLLIAGALPFWRSLHRRRRLQSALAGVNAAVVGLLLAAWYQPLWANAIRQPKDFALAFLCWVALAIARWPPWLVVVSGAVGAMAAKAL